MTHRSARRRNDGESECGLWVGDANRAWVWGFSPFLRFVGGFGAFLGAFSFFWGVRDWGHARGLVARCKIQGMSVEISPFVNISGIFGVFGRFRDWGMWEVQLRDANRV